MFKIYTGYEPSSGSWVASTAPIVRMKCSIPNFVKEESNCICPMDFLLFQSYKELPPE